MNILQRIRLSTLFLFEIGGECWGEKDCASTNSAQTTCDGFLNYEICFITRKKDENIKI